MWAGYSCEWHCCVSPPLYSCIFLYWLTNQVLFLTTGDCLLWRSWRPSQSSSSCLPFLRSAAECRPVNQETSDWLLRHKSLEYNGCGLQCSKLNSASWLLVGLLTPPFLWFWFPSFTSPLIPLRTSYVSKDRRERSRSIWKKNGKRGICRKWNQKAIDVFSFWLRKKAWQGQSQLPTKSKQGSDAEQHCAKFNPFGHLHFGKRSRWSQTRKAVWAVCGGPALLYC